MLTDLMLEDLYLEYREDYPDTSFDKWLTEQIFDGAIQSFTDPSTGYQEYYLVEEREYDRDS